MLRFVVTCLRLCLSPRPLHNNSVAFIASPHPCLNSAAFYRFLGREAPFLQLNLLLTSPQQSSNALGIDVQDQCTNLYSLKGLYLLLSARFVVATHADQLRYFRLRRNQLLICLWHGMPFKTLGACERDAPCSIVKESIYLGAHAQFISTSDHFSLALSTCFLAPLSRIHVTGQPSGDAVLDASRTLEQQPSRFCLDSHGRRYRKVVLYAPTYKFHKRGGLARDIDNPYPNLFCLETFDEASFVSMLSEQDILLIVKPHHLEETIFRSFCTTGVKNIRLVTEQDLQSAGLTLAHLMASSDMLITDYSSIYVDYLLLNRPAVFVTNTYQEYKHKRGFILPDNLPRFLVGPHVTTQAALQSAIVNELQSDTHHALRRHIMPMLHKNTDNQSCRRICEHMGIPLYSPSVGRPCASDDSIKGLSLKR
jgi:CDP-glycerol glycerophosphotransferase (TagB/SpsB family)